MISSSIMPKPNLVIIRGLPGSGKTTYAKAKFPTYYF